MRVNQAVCLVKVKRKNGLQHVHRNRRDQRRAFPSILHRITCRNTQQQQPLASFTLSCCDLHLLLPQGIQKRLRIGYREQFPSREIQSAVLRKESQAVKVPAFRIIFQPLPHDFAVLRLFRRHGGNNIFHMGNPIVDRRRKMQGNPLIQPSHIECADLTNRFLIAAPEKHRHERKNAHTYDAKDAKADGQILCCPVFQFHQIPFPLYTFKYLPRFH